jgi:aspartate aminotransferase-like enzyme
MGHMGNLTSAQIIFALEAMEITLGSSKYAFPPGAGIRAAQKILF